MLRAKPSHRPHRFVWMQISKDKYELPIFVAETAQELADICGVSVNTVQSAVCRNEHGEYEKSQYIKVRVEDDDE